jgi:hypothetical protein
MSRSSWPLHFLITRYCDSFGFTTHHPHYKNGAKEIIAGISQWET